MSLDLSSYLTQRSYSWTNWKIVCILKSLLTQYDDKNGKYTIYGYDGPEVHICNIWIGVVPDGVIEGGYSQEQNDADKAEFEASYKPHANKTLSLRTADGRIKHVVDKDDSSSVTLFSHDWTDKTTWYEQAVRVVDEAAVDSGDHLTYSLAHGFIIDNYHGKISNEDYLKDAQNHNYRVVVKVNGTTKVEQNPHYGSGGDYTIDYDVGRVIFLSALSSSDAVSVTYFYAVSSVFTIKPGSGKKLVIPLVEVQFSTDIVLKDTAVFQPYGYVDVFAPQYLQSNGGPYPSGTKIPLGNPTKYKSMSDYQNDAVRSYPGYPAIGGSNWRGAPVGTLVMDWDYLKAKPLYSSYGMELRVSLEHDEPFEGFYGTATFYCGSEDE